MKEITQENLAEFAPDYTDYETRLGRYVKTIGLESQNGNKPYGAAVRKLNEGSAIGFSEEEMKVLELIYKVDERNERFDNDTHIAKGNGGNTAEHPIFMGLAFDSFKDKAGFGPDNFDANSEETLKVAKISQKVHGMIAVHDVGEIVDISLGEQLKAGASYKEPAEEALVAPFKFKLAAYALSSGDTDFYENTIRGIKDGAKTEKERLFQEAVAGNITGDEFVAGVGHFIGAKVAEAEAKMEGKEASPAYAAARDTLTTLFNEAEHGNSLEANLLHLTDRFEGSFHYAHFAGLPGKHTPQNENPADLLSNLFKGDDVVAYDLAKSSTVEGQATYPQKGMTEAYKAVEAEPEATKEIGDKLVTAAVSTILRNTIKTLQKAPPFITFGPENKTEAGVEKTSDPARRDELFTKRLNIQRGLLEQALPAMRDNDRVVTSLEGTVDTKAVIAVHKKAADLLDSGEWRPDTSKKLVIPVTGELPEAIQVNRQEIRDAIREHPLEVASKYRGQKYHGESVSLGR